MQKRELQGIFDKLEGNVKENSDLTEFEKILRKVKTEEEYTAYDWLNLGDAAYYAGEYEKAIDNYTKAIEINPEDAMAYNNRGVAYHKLEQYENAISDLTKAIEIHSEESNYYRNRGVSYHHFKQYEKAIKDFTKAIEIDPENIQAYKNLSEVLIVKGAYDEALRKTKKALEKAKETKDIIICHYLKCSSEKLLGKDTTESEKQIDQLIKEDFILNWSFDGIENWLKDADIDKDTREFIIEKTDMLKAKQ